MIHVANAIVITSTLAADCLAHRAGNVYVFVSFFFGITRQPTIHTIINTHIILPSSKIYGTNSNGALNVRKKSISNFAVFVEY